MIALIQRVLKAQVDVEGKTVASIAQGVLAFICAERADELSTADRLLQKMLNYRIFADDEGKMNRSVVDIGGALLLVPQFTLAANTSSGTRPSFTPAAPPELGRSLFQYLVGQAQRLHAEVEVGVFGADMQVALVNDGPVTFWLRMPAQPSAEAAS